MGLRPGSYLWLVQHDMRLGARGFSDMFARRSTFAAWAAGISGVVAMHLLAWPAVIWLQPMIEAPGSELYIIVVLGCILAWVVAQGVLGATRLLFARGDLDLLLGSPLPVTRVFAARATALAAGSFGSIALMTLPIANVGAVLDRLSWLALYPVLAALALAGTGLGIAIGMGLFYIVGPRHARLIAQLSAALIAGAFVLGVQIVALLPKPMRTAFFDMIGAGGRSSWFDEGASMRVLIGAVRGEAEPVAWVFAASLALFGLVVVVLGRAFAHATIRTAGAPPEGDGALSEGRRPVRFTSGLGRSLRRKEWRLMLRDPNMAAQFALQLIYTVPVAVILMRSKIDFPTAMAVAPTLVVIATQISASLAWIAVSGEDAPELIAAAPVRAAEVDRAKLLAIALPVGLIIAIPLAGLAWLSLATAGLTLACAIGGSTSTALLNLWHPMPGKRRGMLQRHSQSKLLGLVEHSLAMLWAVATVLALLGSILALIPIAIVAIVLASWYPAWPKRRAGGEVVTGMAVVGAE